MASTDEFERELTDLIASAFARGVPVERTWEVEIPASAAPNWSVEIAKSYADEEPTYEPEFVE
ncbi:hypothetical protein [Halovivax sp.]|uniref:hypothetical protein n=1 Tax=Halovivax sp. TaxID=1935978 RepID=UPI0025BFA411|nr:hypothetical protein [Halovivax sp.]